MPCLLHTQRVHALLRVTCAPVLQAWLRLWPMHLNSTREGRCHGLRSPGTTQWGCAYTFAGELAGPRQFVAGPGLMRSATQPQGMRLSSGYGASGGYGSPGNGNLTRCGCSTSSWPGIFVAANAACSIATNFCQARWRACLNVRQVEHSIACRTSCAEVPAQATIPWQHGAGGSQSAA